MKAHLSKHTPGPWIYERPFITAPPLREGDSCTEVCEIVESDGDGNEIFEPFRESDARLIATAPDLLEAAILQHQAIDTLLAMVIAAVPGFMPTESAVWGDIVKSWETIKRAKGEA